MSASERHNRLAREFIMEVAGQTGSDAELMVVVESTILGAMLILKRRYGYRPDDASEMVEAAILAAVERFTAGGGL